jgi:hypothetical protein
MGVVKMQEDKSIEFPSGLYVNRPSDGNKHFLFGKIDITRKELGNWLRSKEEDKIQIDILYSKTKVDDFGNPKLYLAVDDGSWKKNNNNSQQTQESAPQQRDEFEDKIPF